MVCTFMLIVLPALFLRSVYSFWTWMFGKKQQKVQEPAAEPADKDAAAVKKPAAKGTCPYHVVMRLLGFKIPEKKQLEQT